MHLKLHVIQSFNELRTFIFFAGGKRNERLILPLNSSLSVTLDKKEVIDLFTPMVTSSSTWENRGLVFKISDSHEVIKCFELNWDIPYFTRTPLWKGRKKNLKKMKWNVL